MPAPVGLLNYVFGALSATPVVLGHLVRGIEPGDSIWDFRPNSDRFTLREAIAHLADWEEIFIGRIIATRDQVNPILKSVDEGELCTLRNYSSTDVNESIAKFINGRNSLLALVQSLDTECWDRKCHREFVGDIDMYQLVTIIMGHDAYHLRQVAEYLETRS